MSCLTRVLGTKLIVLYKSKQALFSTPSSLHLQKSIQNKSLEDIKYHQPIITNVTQLISNIHVKREQRNTLHKLTELATSHQTQATISSAISDPESSLKKTSPIREDSNEKLYVPSVQRYKKRVGNTHSFTVSSLKDSNGKQEEVA